jgi:hypothetical protein
MRKTTRPTSIYGVIVNNNNLQPSKSNNILLLDSNYYEYNLGDDEDSTFMASNVRSSAIVFILGQVVVVKRLMMEAKIEEGEFSPRICKVQALKVNLLDMQKSLQKKN